MKNYPNQGDGTRTHKYRSQNPVPYRLATPHCFGGERPSAPPNMTFNIRDTLNSIRTIFACANYSENFKWFRGWKITQHNPPFPIFFSSAQAPVTLGASTDPLYMQPQAYH